MKTSEIRGKLKRSSFVFVTYKKLTDGLYRSSVIDYWMQKKYKPRKTVKMELNLMKDYWKCDTMNYFRYRLYERTLTREELLDYIPSFYFYNRYVPSIYSETRIKEAASKIMMNNYFSSRSIKAPVVIAVITKKNIYNSRGEIIDYARFVEDMKKSDSHVFFMKPDKGQGGKGIYRIEKSGGDLLINRKVITRDYLCKITERHDYIIQEGVTQRSDITGIYPLSVNTLRVVTQNFDGKPRISVAMFRMGRNGTFVDNTSSGGISTGIDLETGMIGKYAIDLEKNRKFDRHPDTGFVFEGFIIKRWDEIKAGIIDFATKTPEFPDVGWDIAIVEDGIVAIEFNLNYGIDLQGIVGGLRRMLSIDPFTAPVKLQIPRV